MQRAAIAAHRVFESWLDYQHALIRAIAPLTDAQLALRPLPGRRSIGEIAEHIVFGRALHVYRTLGSSAEARTPLQAWGAPGASLFLLDGREVFSAYEPSPKGPVFMTLIEQAFWKEVTTRTRETVRKCASA